MGRVIYTIYDRAVEEGYQAGVTAHLDFIRYQGDGDPAMFDEQGFRLVLDRLMPQGLTEHNASL